MPNRMLVPAIAALALMTVSADVWAQAREESHPRPPVGTKGAVGPGSSAGAVEKGVSAGPASYTFTLNSFQITDTRALHNDTDLVSISVAVGNKAPITLPAKSMGDVNNGGHQVNLS